jgi:hypothetical protein
MGDQRYFSKASDRTLGAAIFALDMRIDRDLRQAESLMPIRRLLGMDARADNSQPAAAFDQFMAHCWAVRTPDPRALAYRGRRLMACSLRLAPCRVPPTAA